MEYEIYRFMEIGEQDHVLLAKNIELDVHMPEYSQTAYPGVFTRGKTCIDVASNSEFPNLLLRHNTLVLKAEDGTAMGVHWLGHPAHLLEDGRLRVRVAPT